jgi:oligosaccharide repeat unit polymerase
LVGDSMVHELVLSHGSLLLVHLALTAVCGYIVLSSLPRVRSHLVPLMLFGGLGLLHGAVPAATQSHLLPETYHAASRIVAAHLALVSVLLLWFGWRAYEKFAPGAPATVIRRGPWEPPASKHLMRRVQLVCAILGPAAFLLQVHFHGWSISDSLNADRFALRGSGNVTLAALANHGVGLVILPGFLGFFVDRRAKIFGIFFALTLAVAIFVLTKGERATSLGILGSLVSGYVMSRQITAGRLLVVVVGLSILLAASISLYRLRHVMSNASLAESLCLLVSWEIYEEAVTQDPLNYHEMFVQAVDNFPRRHDFLGGASYRRLLFFFLPSSKFPGIKPADTNALFADVVRPEHNLQQLTVPPTIPGDMYINFGPLGIGLLFFTGLLLAWVSRQILTREIWFLALGPNLVRLTIVGLRGQPYEVTLTAIGLLVFVACLRCCLVPRRKPAIRPVVVLPPPPIRFGTRRRTGMEG